MKIFLVVHTATDSPTNYDAFKTHEDAEACAEEICINYYSDDVELEREGDVWSGEDEGREIRTSILEVDLQ